MDCSELFCQDTEEKPTPTTVTRHQSNSWAPEIESYQNEGVVVIKQVLSPETLLACRTGLHRDLLDVGINFSTLNKSDCQNLKNLQSHQSGGLPFYYCNWQMKYCHTNERLFSATRAIWGATWATMAPTFDHPYGKFDPTSGFAFLDSFGVNFRLPSEKAKNIQKTIGLHIDLNPWDKFGSGRRYDLLKNLFEVIYRMGKRWRPMQGFIALTNQDGGFECIKGNQKK